MIEFQLNGNRVSADVDPATPLLWVLRDTLHLHGTKYGCGMAQCGACTVHVGGQAMRSCILPVGSLGDREVTTIEGIRGPIAAALKAAWEEIDVPQCGYCQTGQILSAAVLLAERTDPSDGDIDACMAGNACRCATYVRIRAAIHAAAARIAGGRR